VNPTSHKLSVYSTMCLVVPARIRLTSEAAQLREGTQLKLARLPISGFVTCISELIQGSIAQQICPAGHPPKPSELQASQQQVLQSRGIVHNSVYLAASRCPYWHPGSRFRIRCHPTHHFETSRHCGSSRVCLIYRMYVRTRVLNAPPLPSDAIPKVEIVTAMYLVALSPSNP